MRRYSITRSSLLTIFGSLAVLAHLPFGSSHAQDQPDRPNIVFIVADDLGYGDLSSYGRGDYSTPNIDLLVEGGVRFTQAYAAAPVCTPSRVGFMTARYPARTDVGLREPLTGRDFDRDVGLPAGHPTVSSLLKANGYETALVGKWHLGYLPGSLPNDHGFDEFFGILDGGADYISHVDLSRNPGLYKNGDPVHVEGYLTDLLTERAVSFISRPHTRPFFLNLQYTAPHWPWQGPGDGPHPHTAGLLGVEAWAGGGSAATYAEMMERLDAGIGEVLAALDRNGLGGQTLVIFTSDNGGERYSDMAGLSGGKMELWEGGIRVPAAARWPDVLPAGVPTDQVAVTMDWSATILAAAGVAADPDYPLDGMNLLPTMRGDAPIAARTLFWRTFQRTKHKAVRSGEWKYMNDGNDEYLFNLMSDPGEKRDLKAEHPERLAQLRALYSDWESQMLEPAPLP